MLPDGPLTARMALASGVTRSGLRRLVDNGLLVRLCRDVDLPSQLAGDHGVRAAALALVIPAGACASHQSAAWLYGVELQEAMDPVRATVPRGVDVAPRPALVVRQALLPRADVVTVGGLRVTSPVRTALDLARTSTLVEATVAVDALLHLGTCTVAGVTARLPMYAGWRGVRQARAVVELAEPLAESPMETRLRFLLIQAGLPRPVAQHVVVDADGEFVARVDLAYPGLRIAIEYDGRDAHLEAQAFVVERRRQNRLLALGWVVVRFTATDVYRQSWRVAREVRAALSRRAA
ncbi:MAG: hypothetical protein M3Z02_09035 [Actinomycetota bacterium]|nr:hypothetical protein [Actinomycetota bacterium]